MYRCFTKTDGLKVFIREADIIGYEQEQDYMTVITIIGDFDVIQTIDEIFGGNQNIKFSRN